MDWKMLDIICTLSWLEWKGRSPWESHYEMYVNMGAFCVFHKGLSHLPSVNLKLFQAVRLSWHLHFRYPLHQSWLIGELSFSNKKAWPLKTIIEPIEKASKELCTEDKISNTIISLEEEKKNFNCRWMSLKRRRTKHSDNGTSDVLIPAQTDVWHTIPW